MGLYETDELFVIKNILKPDDRVVDIGAGVGFVSAYIARQLNSNGWVECFEANPALIPRIRRTHEINNVDVKVSNRILSHSEGELDFYVSPHFWASSTLKAEGTSLVRIPSTSFQDLLDQRQPTMLVVDIEGGEIDLFKGMEFSSVNKICIELHPNFTGINKMNVMLDELYNQGFKMVESWSKPAVKALVKSNS